MRQGRDEFPRIEARLLATKGTFNPSKSLHRLVRQTLAFGQPIRNNARTTNDVTAFSRMDWKVRQSCVRGNLDGSSSNLIGAYAAYQTKVFIVLFPHIVLLVLRFQSRQSAVVRVSVGGRQRNCCCSTLYVHPSKCNRRSAKMCSSVNRWIADLHIDRCTLSAQGRSRDSLSVFAFRRRREEESESESSHAKVNE